MEAKIEFAQLNGCGIKVGVVDSGFSHTRLKVNPGQGINFCKNRNAECDQTYTADRIGHGTACTGIIVKKAPDVTIFPIKVFDQDLVSNIDILTSAAEWALEQKLNILNLSLGTTDSSQIEKFIKISDKARQNNLLIVAANSNNSQKSYPACLPNVFGVMAGAVRGRYDYFFDRARDIQFIARGDYQRLHWKDGKQIFLGGTSFAAPHITAILALLLQKYPDISFNELLEKLTENSLSSEPSLVDGQEFYNIPGVSGLNPKPTAKLSEVHKQNNINWINKAVVFPYNKEMHGLIRYKDMLPFSISAIVDVVGRRTIGKDSGEVIGALPSNIIVQKSVKEALTDADTLVLGYLDEISRIKRRDIKKEMLELALEHGKNVYSLSPIVKEHYSDLLYQFDSQNLHVSSPMITFDDFKSITRAFDWRTPSRVPIVGVFGTSPQQGKFTAQLALRKELQKLGYTVGQLGTEHQSALFGFDFTFPNGYDGQNNIRIPMDMHITFLHSVMAGIENNNPHIIIVGGQSGLIPYSYAERSQVYTISSLLLLMGTIPDAYVLVVNSIDEHDFIQENINVLKGLGKGETILLVFSDKRKKVVNNYGRSSIINQPLSSQEIAEIASRLENRFGIPATEIVSEQGRQKMATTVENYFAEESQRPQEIS